MGAKTRLISNLLILFGLFTIVLCVVALLDSEQIIDACIILQLEDYNKSEFVECAGDTMLAQNIYVVVGLFGVIMPCIWIDAKQNRLNS